MKPLNECQTLQEIFSSPERWTQGAFARDKDGNKIEWHSNKACSFCLMGAYKRLSMNNYENSITARDKLFFNKLHSIPEFNDNPETTFEDIQKLVKELDI